VQPGSQFRRIDEIHALSDRQVQLRPCFLFGVLFAPGHRAQAHDAHIQVAAPEFDILHFVMMCEEEFKECEIKEGGEEEKNYCNGKPNQSIQ
jgi:hypothetical protein